MLNENSFEDIICEDKPQLLFPLINLERQRNGELQQFWSEGVKLYRTSIESEAEITVIEPKERKTFTITTKGENFGDIRKNPTLHGDFGINIKMKKQTYTCWLNINIFQIASKNFSPYLEEGPCEHANPQDEEGKEEAKRRIQEC